AASCRKGRGGSCTAGCRGRLPNGVGPPTTRLHGARRSCSHGVAATADASALYWRQTLRHGAEPASGSLALWAAPCALGLNADRGPTCLTRDRMLRIPDHWRGQGTMSDERTARIHKVEELRASGIDPYPTQSHRTHTAAEALAHFETLQSDETQVTLVGRLMQLREMGKAAFAHIEDGSGRIQIYIKRDSVGDEAFKRLKLIDPGDFIEATGTLFTTKTGEQTLHVDAYRLLSKALLPLPSKGAGGDLKLFDPELRQRKRYLDLIANREEVVPVFVARAKTLQAMRDFLNARGFVEVETPILQPLYGGATARPFITPHTAADRDMYLRIAPELYLKRLTVGGIERVYEIARNFRNEGVDRSHNPEFTMMECYQAYADYQDMMRLVEE